MAPRNNHPLEDASSSTDVSIQEETPETDAATIATNEEGAGVEQWAASEGYTPLTDMNLTDGGTMFMAFPPNDEDHRGAFVTDMAAFAPTTTSLEEEDDVVEEEEHDFRNVAEQALAQLDSEYSECAGVTSALTIEDDSKVTEWDTDVQEDDDDEETLPHSTATIPEKQNPPIDTDAVRRAVDAIRLKAPKLTADLDKWQPKTAAQPETHDIIPKAPLSAFRKRSPKAIAASANLSRSATLAEAVHRLSIGETDRLVIHVVGADHIECDSDDTVRTAFGPLVRWIGALEASPKHIEVHLIGPNVPADAIQRPPTNLMPSSSGRLVSASATCHQGTYHDWLSSTGSHPSLAVAFDSGIWGYKEWVITLQALCKSSFSIPFVSTAYTIQECEDDADVIETTIREATTSENVDEYLLWKAQVNPFGSNKIRETATAVAGRHYRENAAWQAWKLGGV